MLMIASGKTATEVADSPVPQREDHQHLSVPGAAEDEHEEQRRVLLLRDQTGTARLTVPVPARVGRNADARARLPSYATIRPSLIPTGSRSPYLISQRQPMHAG